MVIFRIFSASRNPQEALGMGLRFQLLFIFSLVYLFPHPPNISASIVFYGFAWHRAANCPQLFLFFSSAVYYLVLHILLARTGKVSYHALTLSTNLGTHLLMSFLPAGETLGSK